MVKPLLRFLGLAVTLLFLAETVIPAAEGQLDKLWEARAAETAVDQGYLDMERVRFCIQEGWCDSVPELDEPKADKTES